MPHLACLLLPFLHQTLSNTPPSACNPSASCRGGDTSSALLCFGGSELTIPPSTLSGEAGSRRSLPSPPPRRRGQPWPASGRSRGLARPFPGLSKPFPVLAVPFRSVPSLRDVRPHRLLAGRRAPPPCLRLPGPAGQAAAARVGAGGALPTLLQQGPAVQQPRPAVPQASPAGSPPPAGCNASLCYEGNGDGGARAHPGVLPGVLGWVLAAWVAPCSAWVLDGLRAGISLLGNVYKVLPAWCFRCRFVCE